MIKYALFAILIVCAGVPLVLWYPSIHNAVIPIGHQGQTYPVSTLPVAVVIVPPPREIRSFAWFAAHPSTIEPARVQCAHGSQTAQPDQAECQNADRASLHMFNEALREKY